jgi:hypothetical protein
MYEHGNFGVREHLDGLPTQDDRANAAAAVRGHDDKATDSAALMIAFLGDVALDRLRGELLSIGWN